MAYYGTMKCYGCIVKVIATIVKSMKHPSIPERLLSGNFRTCSQPPLLALRVDLFNDIRQCRNKPSQRRNSKVYLIWRGVIVHTDKDQSCKSNTPTTRKRSKQSRRKSATSNRKPRSTSEYIESNNLDMNTGHAHQCSGGSPPIGLLHLA